MLTAKAARRQTSTRKESSRARCLAMWAATTVQAQPPRHILSGNVCSTNGLTHQRGGDLQQVCTSVYCHAIRVPEAVLSALLRLPLLCTNVGNVQSARAMFNLLGQYLIYQGNVQSARATINLVGQCSIYLGNAQSSRQPENSTCSDGQAGTSNIYKTA